MNELDRLQTKSEILKKVLQKDILDLTIDEKRAILILLKDYIIELSHDLKHLENNIQFGLKPEGLEFDRINSLKSILQSIINKNLDNLTSEENETFKQIISRINNMLQFEIMKIKNNLKLYDEIFADKTDTSINPETSCHSNILTNSEENKLK